jgi:hypothetical protein
MQLHLPVEAPHHYHWHFVFPKLSATPHSLPLPHNLWTEQLHKRLMEAYEKSLRSFFLFINAMLRLKPICLNRLERISYPWSSLANPATFLSPASMYTSLHYPSPGQMTCLDRWYVACRGETMLSIWNFSSTVGVDQVLHVYSCRRLHIYNQTRKQSHGGFIWL